MNPREIPVEVLAAARIVSQWAEENGVQNWKIAALASRDELERVQSRYAAAREMGAQVVVERWRGPGLATVTGDAFDRVVDARIAKSRLALGEVVSYSRVVLKGT